MLNDRLKQRQEIQYLREQFLSKFPLLGPTMMSLKTTADDRIGTAATDGHTIIYSPKFFATLSDEQKEFVFAHEVMHVAFNHVLRSKGREQRLWNIATDSVINQILKNENLPLVEGGVDIAEAVNHSAEEMYEKLLKKKEQREQEKQQEQGQQQEQSQSGDAEQPQSLSEQNQSGQEQQQNEQKGQEQSKQQSDSSENKPDSKSEQSSDNQQDASNSQNGQGSSSQSENTDWDDSDIDWNSEDEQVGHDTHDIWKEAVKQAEREEQRKQEQSRKGSLWDKLKEVIGQKENSEKQEEHSQKNEVFVPQDENKDAYEKGFLENNRRERHVQAERIRKELTEEKNSISEGRNLGDVGVTQTPVADWRKILKKSIEEEKDRWSYRRSGAENDYMARVEELEDEGRPDTEVMLDASGSVDIRLLREFLRQLKPLLKSSKLKVGCFDDFAYGFKEIKTKADIDNFQVTSRFGGTNGEAAVRAFSKKKEVNKIIFTDGYLELDSMPEEDLKGKKNIIWIVYENENFSPCCGKVIQVSRKKILSYALNRAHLREGR